MTPENYGKKKDILILIAAIAAVFILGIILKGFIGVIPQSIRPLGSDIEILSDIFPVFVSLSIFAMTWFAYSKSGNKHSLFLGAAFLVIGLIDLFHLLSYPFMPDFITANSFQKAGILYSEARLVSAVLLVASTYFYRDSLPKWINRPVLFLSAMILFVLSIFPVLYSPDSIPAVYSEDGFTEALIIRLLLTTVLILIACYQYARRIQETGEKHLEFLIYGFIFLITSDLVYFNYELSGHLLKLGGFLCIHMGLYKSSVELPYEKLAEAEDRLRMAAEERYRNLFDNASDAIVTVDLEKNITSWNQAAEKIFGWKENEVIGEKLLKILVPQSGHIKMEKIIRSVISGTAISGIDVVCPHKNGKTVDVSLSVSPLRDANQNIIGMSGILRDITERKRAEELLKESEEKYRKLVEYSPFAIAVHQYGKLVYVNKAVIELIGTNSADNLIGKAALDFVHPDYKKIAIERIQQLHGENETVPTYEEKFIRYDGRIIDVEVTAIKIIYQGQPSIQVIIHDITERKKSEKMRIENEKLALASKAKSEFLANMSHELRTPLNSIIGFSELMTMNTSLDNKQKHYLDNILTSGKFLLNLINDILDLSKVEAGKIDLVIDKIDVPSVMDETLTLIKEKASKHNVILKKELDPALSYIEADQQRLKQILFNLLSNAVKFSKQEGGTVTLTAKKEGDMAKFSVSDTGIGIREEDKEKLFSTFEQLDSGITKKYGGTGLGLAITKKLVELQGGRITVESRHGEGSTFTFYLPIGGKNE